MLGSCAGEHNIKAEFTFILLCQVYLSTAPGFLIDEDLVTVISDSELMLLANINILASVLFI